MFKPILILPLFLAPAAASANQRIIADSHLPADFAPASATPMGAGGFWAAGTANGLAALVRYEADGSVRFLRYPAALNPKSIKLAVMPDGGVASTDIEEIDVFADLECRLRRFDADGNLLWSSDLAQPQGIQVGAQCSKVYIDGAGTPWLFPAGFYGGYIVPVGPDGTSGPQIPIGNVIARGMTAATGEAAVFLAGATGDLDSQPSNTLATVWKITAQGFGWSVSAPLADAGSVLDDIVTASDGSLWSFGHKGAQLYAMHVGTDGSLLGSGSFDSATTPGQVKVVARPDGGAFTLHWDRTAFENHQAGSAPELSGFSSSGTRLWHVPSTFAIPAGANETEVVIAAASNGDLLAALAWYGGGQPDMNHYVQQLRRDANADPLYSTAAQAMQALTGLELHPLGDDSSVTVTGAFRRLGRNAETLPAPQTGAITTAASLDESEVLAPDGSVYLLVVNAASKVFGVSAYSSAGALRWHTSIASSWNSGGLIGAHLALRSGDVCVAGYLDGNEFVQCFALGDGMAGKEILLASSLDPSATRTQLAASAAGELVLLYKAGDGSLRHALLDAQGNVLHDVAPLLDGETWLASAQNANGETVLGTSPAGLLKLAFDGSRSYAVVTDISFGSVALAPDGSTILTSYSTAPVIERVDTAGNRLWQSTMPAGPYNTVRAVRFSGNDIYFALVNNFGFGVGQPILTGLFVKLSLADGDIEWSAPYQYVFGHAPRLALDTVAGNLFAFSTWGNRTMVRKLAMADGTPLGAKLEPCGVDACELYDAIVASDGTLRMVHDTTDLYSGSAWLMTTMQDEFDKVFADGFDP